MYAINGVREATLKLNFLTPNENGRYHCEMKRGYETAKMKPIGIMVIGEFIFLWHVSSISLVDISVAVSKQKPRGDNGIERK